MTDRNNPGGGGLTGATGDLTPDAPDHAFEPGERREVEGPDRGQVTYRQGIEAPSQQAVDVRVLLTRDQLVITSRPRKLRISRRLGRKPALGKAHPLAA